MPVFAENENNFDEQQSTLSEDSISQPFDVPNSETTNSTSNNQVSEDMTTESTDFEIQDSSLGTTESRDTYIIEDSSLDNSKSADLATTIPIIKLSSHIQSYGWQEIPASSDVSAGTTGEGKRLEALSLSVTEGKIEYSAHVQSYGWQDYVSDGEVAGSIGQSKRLEAIKIKLSDELAKKYDIYYRVHVQTLGWLDWASNGAPAGTVSIAKRIEALQISIVDKNKPAPGKKDNPFYASLPKLTLSSHIQSQGNKSTSGILSVSGGTTGIAKRIEGISLAVSDPLLSGGMEYRVHVQSYGWQPYHSNGEFAGTSGESKRLEAIQIHLTGELANTYNLYYRTHIQKKGWTEWSQNDEPSGSLGLAYRMEAIQIMIQTKNHPAPTSSNGNIAFYGMVKADPSLGTTQKQADFINKHISTAREIGQKFKLYPSVLLAQACLESSYGTSALAKNAQNYFGLKFRNNEDAIGIYPYETHEWDEEKGIYYSVVAEFSKYKDFQNSALGYTKRIRNGVSWDSLRYQGVWRENTSSFKDATKALTNTYATDPNYGTKLNTLISNWRLYDFD